MATGPWTRVSRELATSSEHEFVRRARPLLHILWPNLVETPHKQKWDSAGIDLVDWVNDGPFPTVVQAKGFHVQKIGPEQAKLVSKSVDSFLAAGCVCEHFVLVHNRDGRFTEFNRIAQASLERLKAAGVATKVSLLDRQQLIVQCRARVDGMIEEALRAAAARRLKRFSDLFEAKTGYIDIVPFTGGAVHLRRNEPSTASVDDFPSDGSVTKVLLRQRGLSWTILEGMFGSGKTTTVLHTAESRDRVVVLVSCADLPNSSVFSFNELLRQAVQDADLWADREEDEKPLLESLAAHSAIQLLSGVASMDRYLMVVDGIDEHRAFSSLGGLKRLLNQLIDVECPIVLTTRSEHLATLFDNYTSALADLSWKFKEHVPLPLLRLEPWNSAQSAALVQAAIPGQANAADRLRQLRIQIDSGEAAARYGDILFNPLMLRFIIDDTAAGATGGVTRGALITRWAQRKLWRDVTGHIALAVDDVGRVVDTLFAATASVASLMTEERDGRIRLTESVSYEDARAVVAQLTEIGMTDVLVNSFLMTTRTTGKVRVLFPFRILQEFFLAAHYVRLTLDPARLPAPVKLFHHDLAGPATSRRNK